MHALSLLATWFSLIFVPVLGQVSWDATPFNPASVPLAVRSPFLSAWLAQGSGTALNDAWPTFWTGSVSILATDPFCLRSSVLVDPWLGRFRQSRRHGLQLDGCPKRPQRQLPEGYPEEPRGERYETSMPFGAYCILTVHGHSEHFCHECWPR